ncbi:MULTISPECIES: alpha-amylase family glycosyl hydrolase [unclassified Leptolyngbya]|uniref:alpha-amylase family glycosyl hydrolase n=1 Tax=unclassified Leptolyngbya TaxID=2650499 RepID=UPI001684EFED|nr:MULTISPECIES: alpha-amylase family glycosyl hydrolase [unclassified Leptolyngbya]MBD1913353.1 alpha-amylase [Leptolyngbya sp. FACHB-8]MBD2158716.1 alpha-amylase [Leptolyngbya sp. FACHB-16]
MASSRHPLLYQVNTRVLLQILAKQLNRPATLDDIPDTLLDEWAIAGFDWIYVLGIWQTGTAAPQVSRSNPVWMEEHRQLLSDLNDEDVCGSCFAVTGYTVHTAIGGHVMAERLRDRLHQRGLKLMLDFVPNHTAPDHPWVQTNPEFYIQGTEEQLAQEPENYCRIKLASGEQVFAYGRDPYFPGWCDTLQLNYGNSNLHMAQLDELMAIAQLCDGVRCDMAMLILPEIFQRIWGIPMEPFWERAFEKVRALHPDFVFMAEVYWDMEWVLQQKGFDFTYDKGLYDRLREQHARPVREHFWADLDYQNKSARFLENHDEQRAATAFPPDVHEAAAIISFFCPGLRFFHQGQREGYRHRISIHLNRGPQEPVDPRLEEFYKRLLQTLKQPLFREGTWQLLEAQPAWDGNWTADNAIAFGWTDDKHHGLVVVNYAPHQSQFYVSLPFNDLDSTIHLEDLMHSNSYDRPDSTIHPAGLYFDLPPWGYGVFELSDRHHSKS